MIFRMLLIFLYIIFIRCDSEIICDKSCSPLLNIDSTCCGIGATYNHSSSVTSCGTCLSPTCHGNRLSKCTDRDSEQQCQAYKSSKCVIKLANPSCNPSSHICWGTIESTTTDVLGINILYIL